MSDQQSAIPQHVAVVMDGNGRWANKRGKPRYQGHRQGVQSVKQIVKTCIKHRIHYLTLFAFSSENWKRPPQEVKALMNLLLNALNKEISELVENDVQLHFIGDLHSIPKSIRCAMQEATSRTADNTTLVLTIAIGYGGQWDITQASQQIAYRAIHGEIDPADVDQTMIAKHLSTANTPAPDLLIRTGGEYRLSNFLLWQLAYTELYFTKELWPDFNEGSFVIALQDYAKRQRRYGITYLPPAMNAPYA